MTDNAIITAAQNIAIAINALVKSTNNATGTSNSATQAGGVTGQIITGTGRLNNVTVVVSAVATVNVYDAANTSNIAASNLLVSIPSSTVPSTIKVDKIYKNGLVLVTGAGVSANITYSPF